MRISRVMRSGKQAAVRGDAGANFHAGRDRTGEDSHGWLNDSST